jgi:deoxyribodipyrimidine photo-lyase
LLEALAARARVVVTDDSPAFFLPRMLVAATGRLDVRCEAVDGNGISPLGATDRVFTTAASFRRYLHKALPPLLEDLPLQDPLPRLGALGTAPLAHAALERWPAPSPGLLGGNHTDLAALPIDHHVGEVDARGGADAAGEQLDGFLRHRLAAYGEDRNHPDEDAASGLSPYLHFGHISAHEVVCRVLEGDDWSPGRIVPEATGKRAGFWGASPSVESFLDEVITWREIGFNRCHLTGDSDRYESLPDWARATLSAHAGDPRPHLYDLDTLTAAQTDDPIWNAAQRQLVRTGRMHNYLRMLWGKRILEWSPTPRRALEVMTELNNRWALDGRDPNSTSGIFWCLGRYDRAWGPERSIFGKVRYMSSRNTRRKLRMEEYLARFSRD